MSGSISLSAAALTDAEKADVRRFMGYPAYGSSAQNAGTFVFSLRYKAMEFRLVNARPEELQTIRLFLSKLYTLEAAIWSASDNLDTDRAAVWTHNKNEVRDRTALFRQTRRDLCGFLGLPPGPGLDTGSVTLVV